MSLQFEIRYEILIHQEADVSGTQYNKGGKKPAHIRSFEASRIFSCRDLYNQVYMRHGTVQFQESSQASVQ
jgi:hypothetical protein